MTTIAFDLDGTLFRKTGFVNYDDPDSIRENTRAIPELMNLAHGVQRRDGDTLAIVTGRTQDVRPATRDQLEDANLEPDAIMHQPRWDGHEEMARWKAEALELIGADVYVGDAPADRDAAEQADVVFVDAYGLRTVTGADRAVIA